MRLFARPGDSDLEDAEPDVTAADIEAAERADAAVAAAAGKVCMSYGGLRSV